MKRTLSLIVLLLGLAAGAILTGCNPPADTTTPPSDTNAVPSAPNTNAP